MAENKTKPEEVDVVAFLNSIEDETKRKDSLVLLQLYKDAMKMKPKLWSGGMVGFGERHYEYESGHSGDIFLAGFAPRKAALTLYILSDNITKSGLLDKLGKYKTGKGCLYIKKLEDVDIDVLRKIIQLFAEDVLKK